MQEIHQKKMTSLQQINGLEMKLLNNSIGIRVKATKFYQGLCLGPDGTNRTSNKF